MKILNKTLALTSILILGLGNLLTAQTLLNGFMAGKNGGGISFSGTHEHYNELYLYPEKIEDIPVFKEVSVNSFNIYGNYGISNKLDLIINVPFIQTVGSAHEDVLSGLGYVGQMDGVQDVSAFLKYEFAKYKELSLQGSFGVSTPLSNYEVDEGMQSILAIGNQATTFNGFLLAHYKDQRGFFITGQAGYSMRTTEVPDAILSELKIGFAASRFYIAGRVGNQTSTSGVDILRPGFTNFFPATKVNYTKVGGTIYTPLDGNLGLSVSGGTTVYGRNTGKAYYGSVGVTYNFIYKSLTSPTIQADSKI